MSGGLQTRMATSPDAVRGSDGDGEPGAMTEFFNNPMTEFLMWTGLVLAVLLAIGWFLSYTAVRLDRLHHRLLATSAALDAQLVRRAETTLIVALSVRLDPATSTLLAGAATQALESPTGRWDAERVEAETGLTEILRAVDGGLVPEDASDPDDDITRLRGAGLRVQLARRFHNEAVADVVRLRERPHTRWFRLAGHAPTPQPVEFDDQWPAREQLASGGVDGEPGAGQNPASHGRTDTSIDMSRDTGINTGKDANSPTRADASRDSSIETSKDTSTDAPAVD